MKGLQMVLDNAAQQEVGFTVIAEKYDYQTDMPLVNDVHGVACRSRSGPCQCHAL